MHGCLRLITHFRQGCDNFGKGDAMLDSTDLDSTHDAPLLTREWLGRNQYARSRDD